MRKNFFTRLDIAERPRMLERKRQFRLVQDMDLATGIAGLGTF